MKRSPSILAMIAIVFALIVSADQRIRLVPRFTVGETFRYQVDTRTTISSKTTTPILNPEGGSKSSQSISLLVRLDVLPSAAPTQAGAAAPVRLRATYEKSEAKSQADAYDPAAPSLDDPYNRLEGHSIEFTIHPGGAVTDIKGLEEVFPNPSEVDPILSWAKAFSSGPGAPGKGITVGQKWNSERAVAGMPFSDLIWRSDSTYLRNESCDLSAGVDSSAAANSVASKSGAVPESCAVVLTHFQILRRGSPRSDATPPDYLHNGLRTSGNWLGSGESLDSISLVTGLLVRSTQNSTQDVDYEITSASSGSAIHQVGHATTESEIKLVPVAQSTPKY
jgi:hypothetical protein